MLRGLACNSPVPTIDFLRFQVNSQSLGQDLCTLDGHNFQCQGCVHADFLFSSPPAHTPCMVVLWSAPRSPALAPKFKSLRDSRATLETANPCSARNPLAYSLLYEANCLVSPASAVCSALFAFVSKALSHRKDLAPHPSNCIKDLHWDGALFVTAAVLYLFLSSNY